MPKKSKSKVNGELSVEDEKRQLVMPSTNAELLLSTSAMSESTLIPKASQIGFQPTQALGEIDETTANVQVLTAFASKLGALVTWKRLELADGREVIALCFPLGVWEIAPNGSLIVKKAS